MANVAGVEMDPNKAGAQAQAEVACDGKKLRIGIIGCGGIAHAHMGAYLKQNDIEIVAGADIIPGRARAFFDEFNLSDAKDYEDCVEMLEKENLDAVSVCTYNRQHVPCAIAALERGVHVLLEKPMCVTMDEAQELVAVEKKSGKVLTIGFQPRFNDNMKMIKKIVQSGALGKIYYIQTGGGRRRGIPYNPQKDSFVRDDTAGLGALADIGCYGLDMVLNAIDYPKPLTVSGYISDFFGKCDRLSGKEGMEKVFSVDDFGAGFIRLEGDIIVDFRISWAMHADTSGDTMIYGTEGALRVPSTDCWNGDVGGPMTLYHDVAGKRAETVIPKLPGTDLWYDKIRSFLDCIKLGAPNPAPTSQILYNQAIISGIAESARLGHEIEIKL